VGEQAAAPAQGFEGNLAMNKRSAVSTTTSKREVNHLQELREEQLLSKAELARRAGVSALTIDRIERGQSCRLDTKRKIILALGLKIQEKDRVSGNGRGKRGSD
jgi:DNA-binding XRE family transcriptional regulator